LEAFVDVDDEGELELVRYLFLLNYALNFVILKYLVLSHAFDGVVLHRFFMLSKKYLAETALADLLHDCVVIYGYSAERCAAEIEVQIFIIIFGVGDNT
jgi:hypothetical protein